MKHKITKIEDIINLSSKFELCILFNSIKPFWSKRRKRKRKKKKKKKKMRPVCHYVLDQPVWNQREEIVALVTVVFCNNPCSVLQLNKSF